MTHQYDPQDLGSPQAFVEAVRRFGGGAVTMSADHLDTFARAVMADEREACVQVLEALAADMEAAGECDPISGFACRVVARGYRAGAAAIRERGEK